MITTYEAKPSKGMDMQAAETAKKQFPQLSDSLSLTHCPKCQGAFDAPFMGRVHSGFQLIYRCKECSSSFALVPVTSLQLYELPSTSW